MFRFEVLATAFVLALPVLALGARGDLSLEEIAAKAGLCLLAAWVAVGIIRFAAQPIEGGLPPHPPESPDRGPQHPTRGA